MDVVNVAPKIVATMRIPVFIGNIPLKSLYPHLKMPSPGSLNMDFFQANWGKLKMFVDFIVNGVLNPHLGLIDRDVLANKMEFLMGSHNGTHLRQ